jgi:hypothetical protein
MSTSHSLTVEEASRLAVMATVADLAYWASTVAVHGQVSLDDLVDVLDFLREASAPAHSTPDCGAPAAFSVSAAS